MLFVVTRIIFVCFFILLIWRKWTAAFAVATDAITSTQWWYFILYTITTNKTKISEEFDRCTVWTSKQNNTHEMKNAKCVLMYIRFQFKFHLFTCTDWICLLFSQCSLGHTSVPNDWIVLERLKRPVNQSAYSPYTRHNKWMAVCWCVSR